LFSIAGDSVRIVSAITAMLIGLASPLGQGGTAIAAEIKILSSNGLKEVLQDLAPEFSRTTGHKLSMVFDSSAGAKRRIEGGEAFDVALVTPPMIADLVKQGKIVAGTSADIARTGLGVAIRAGAAKPDISTVDAFKRTLLDAKSVAYNKEGQSGIYMAGLMDRLGIAEQMKAKTKLRSVPGPVAEDIAKGEAELGFQLISEILSVRGAELLGPLPSELQTFVVLTSGIAAGTKEAAPARELIKFLAAPDAAQVMKAHGMESLAR